MSDILNWSIFPSFSDKDYGHPVKMCVDIMELIATLSIFPVTSELIWGGNLEKNDYREKTSFQPRKKVAFKKKIKHAKGQEKKR